MSELSRSLWCSLGGEVECDRHFGGYALSELERRPKARRLLTPLGVWERLGAREIARHGYACETCGWTHPARGVKR